MRARSDGWSVTVRDFVRPRCVLTARRYGMQPVGIHWISHTVMVTQQHCISRPLTRLFDCPAPSAASACVRSIARVPEGPPTLCGGRFREQRRGLPLKSHPCAREGRAPPGHGGRHGRRASAPHAGIHGRPWLPSVFLHSGSQGRLQPIHPASVCGSKPRALMEYAGRCLTTPADC